MSAKNALAKLWNQNLERYKIKVHSKRKQPQVKVNSLTHNNVFRR